jgi:hypothetical protein
VTVIAAGPILTVRERVRLTARAIEPILNRVVLAGPSVTALLMTDPAVHAPELTFVADSTLQFLSTSMIDRLGAELQKLGLARIGRAAAVDRWRAADDLTLDLVQVRADDGDPEQVCLEYATLLTLPFTVDGQLVVRIAGAPAVLALECAAYVRSGAPALESEELERAVQLISGRVEIEKECAAAPPELRSIIASSLARLAGGDTLRVLIRRALPDAALLPVLAGRLRDRILRLAA